MPQYDPRFEEPSAPIGRWDDAPSRRDEVEEARRRSFRNAGGADRGAAGSQGVGPEDPYGYRAFGIPEDYNFEGPGRARWDEDLRAQARGPRRDAGSDARRENDRPWGDRRGDEGRGREEDHRRSREPEARNFWTRARDEVSAWFGDDEAARRRRDDTFDHAGRGPKTYRRTDERVREDVCEALTADPILDATGLEVDVREGEVTLSGQVFRRADKGRAEDICESVPGVRHVQNNLRFQDPYADAV